MWSIETGREGLLELLSGKTIRQLNEGRLRRDLGSSLSKGRLQLIWNEQPRDCFQLPSLILTASRESRDFLAWATTFLDSFRPFTALFRVIDGTDWEEIASMRDRPSLMYPNACVALTIAEALTHGRGKVDSKSVNLPSCQSTYSFCNSRALALNSVRTTSDGIAHRWGHCREITLQSPRHPSVADIGYVWNVLLDVSNSDKGVSARRDLTGEVCFQVARNGDVQQQLFSAFPLGIFWKDIDAAMKGTREERVLMFERAVRELLSARTINSALSSLAVGFLAHQMSPGTLDYIDLVVPLMDQVPTVLLWYGLLAGLHPSSQVFNRFGGMGRRLLRDVLEPGLPTDRPTCDISVEELEILCTKKSSLELVRQVLPSMPRVELRPLVWTTVQLHGPAAPHQLDLFAEEREGVKIQKWISDVSRALQELNSSFDRLPVVDTDTKKSYRGRKRR